MKDRDNPPNLGHRLVDAWNAGRLDDLMEAYADQIRMGSFSPGNPNSGEVRSKAEVHELLSRARQDRPYLELVSSLESDTSVSLVLREIDGQLFTVAFKLDGDGKIMSVISLRTQA